MQGSGQGGSGGKRSGTDREARLAAKLRQNLVRRKQKGRAVTDAATLGVEADASGRGDGTSSPADSDQGA